MGKIAPTKARIMYYIRYPRTDNPSSERAEELIISSANDDFIVGINAVRFRSIAYNFLHNEILHFQTSISRLIAPKLISI